MASSLLSSINDHGIAKKNIKDGEDHQKLIIIHIVDDQVSH